VKITMRSAALLSAATLVVAACGTAPEDEADTAIEAATTDDAAAEQVDFKACMVSDEGGFDDQSFNQSGAEGLRQAEAELGVTTNLVESQGAADYGPNIDALLQDDCGIIITVGFAMGSSTVEAALANPDQLFAIVDDTPDGDPSTPDVFDPPPPNVKPLVYDTAQASYLAGYLAAGMTETGTVATYGGRPFPTVTVFMDGFVDGVAKYNEVKGDDVEVLGWDKEAQDGSFTGDFEDENKGKQLTQNFIQQGADIILPVAGPVARGTAAAAQEADGVSVIWVDADGFLFVPEFGDLMLTSVLKQIQGATFEVTQDAVNDEFDGTQYIGTLENDGVGIAPFHDFADAVDDELEAEIEELRTQIIDGSLVVESPSSPQPA
jgi:basic membrane protein A